MAVYCLIDRSGSMASCVDDTIGGFNTFLQSQSPETIVSLTLFDNEITPLYTKKALEADLLTTETFVPRGSTSLLDAIGHVIKSVPSGEVPTIVILTDGFENTSKKYTKLHINDLITEKKNLGWNFVFLAANQDAIQSAGELGIPEGSALTYDNGSVASAFKSASNAIERLRTGETQKVQFTQEERSQALST
jgi:hypothetical protein